MLFNFIFKNQTPTPSPPSPISSTAQSVPRQHVDHYVDVDQAEVDHVDVDQAEVVKASKTSSTVMAVEARANLKVSLHSRIILLAFGGHQSIGCSNHKSGLVLANFATHIMSPM